MDTQISKSAFYKSRSLLGRLSASFKFMNDNSFLFIKLGTCVLLPMLVIQALCSFFYGNVSPDTIFSVGNLILSVIGVLISIVSLCLFNSLIYTLIQKYIELGTLPVYRLTDLKQPLIENTKKVFIADLTVFVLLLLLAAIFIPLVRLSLYTLIVAIPLFFFILVPLVYIECIYLLENSSLVNAVKKSFSLGVRTWSSTFAILFLMSFLIGAIQLIASLPWLIGLVVGDLANGAILDGEAVSLPGFYPYLMSLLAIIAILVSSLSRGAVLITMAFQYASVETARKERLAGDEVSEE